MTVIEVSILYEELGIVNLIKVYVRDYLLVGILFDFKGISV